MNSYILDASALLALINSEKGCEKVTEYLPNASMSAVNVTEVASLLHIISMPNEEIESIINNLITTIIPFDAVQAYQAGKFRTVTKDKGLSLGDRACLALGFTKKLPVVTTDKIWQKLDIGVEVILIR